MKVKSCISCVLPVLELDGQFEKLDLLYTSGSTPPSDTVGWWHASCLAGSPAALSWYEGRLGSLLVRGYHVVAEYSHWIVVRQPQSGHTRALGRGGELLDLSRGSRKRARKVGGGLVYPKLEETFYLELDDIDLIRTIKEELLSTGNYPLPAVVGAMGIADKVVHPEALERGVFRFNKRLQSDWGKRFVAAGAEYGVFVPAELESHIGPFER